MKINCYVLGAAAVILFLISIAGVGVADQQVSTTPPVGPDQAAVTRAYDVRVLIDGQHDYPLNRSAKASAFAGGTFSPDLMPSGGSQPADNFVAGLNNYVTPDRAGRLSKLVENIEALVAPDSWKNAGGGVGVMRDFEGTLIVTQTLENHKLLRAFLDELEQFNSVMVRCEVDWVWLTRGEVKLFKTAAARSPVEPMREIDRDALRSLDPSVKHLHLDVTGPNGQTVSLASGRIRSLITNVTPVVSTGVVGFAPTITNIAAGVALEVTPHVNLDRGSATVELYATFDELGHPRRVSAAAVASQEFQGPTTHAAPTSRPAMDQGNDTLTSGLGARQSNSEFSTIGMNLQELRTTVRIPLGHSMVVSGGTWDPTSKAQDHPLMLVILTVTVLK